VLVGEEGVNGEDVRWEGCWKERVLEGVVKGRGY